MSAGGGPHAVTAIVVAWRSSSFLAECLDSLLAQDHPGGVAVLVVDNDADTATHQVLDGYRGRVGTLRSETNRGFAGGVALALDRVTTPWAFVMNDDARAAPDVVRLLVEAAHGESVAAVQPSVRLLDPATDVSPHGSLTNSTGLEVTPDGYGYDRDWLVAWPSRETRAEPFGATGAAVLLRLAAVRAAGGMDSDLFLYYEDLDLAWRLRLLGLHARHVSAAVVEHRHAMSSVEGSDTFRYYNERNRLLVLARNASWRLAVLQWLRYPATVASLTLARGPRAARTRVRLRAGAAALRGLPLARRKRRLLPPTVPRAAVQAMFRPVRAAAPYRPPPPPLS